jgi:protein gp37
MSKTKIQWTDETWNTIAGCSPASPGCANCYAKKHTLRLHGNPNEKIAYKYRNGFAVTGHPQYVDEPFSWRKPRMVFVNSMADTFHDDVPEEFIQRLFEIMVECPQHIFQILTKRAERLAELSNRLPWPENIWAGVTVESSDYLYRLDFLREVPARVRFVSFEPLIGAVPHIDLNSIDWAIVGGESGSKARMMEVEWARDIRDQCIQADVPFFFKQVGGRTRGKSGRLLDGIEWNEFPDQIAIPGAENHRPDLR